MRALRAALVFASLAAACGNHGHDDHEWTAEELAELEFKWGMEVSLPIVLRGFSFLCPFRRWWRGQCVCLSCPGLQTPEPVSQPASPWQ